MCWGLRPARAPRARVLYVPGAQGSLPARPTYRTYSVRAPAWGVRHVPSSVAPTGGRQRSVLVERGRRRPAGATLGARGAARPRRGRSQGGDQRVGARRGVGHAHHAAADTAQATSAVVLPGGRGGADVLPELWPVHRVRGQLSRQAASQPPLPDPYNLIFFRLTRMLASPCATTAPPPSRLLTAWATTSGRFAVSSWPTLGSLATVGEAHGDGR